MILVFHGENTLASRNALNLAIDRFKRENPSGEIVRLNGDKITETELIEALEASSLFSVPRLVVIEGLLSRRQSREKQKLIDILAKGLSLKDSPSGTLPQGESLASVILWEPKVVAVGTLQPLRGFPTAGRNEVAIPAGFINIQEFKLTRSLFKLLDSLRPGNGRLTSRLLNETIKTDPEEVVIMMLGRRIAQLMVAKGKISDGFVGLADWQIGRLTAQAANWSEKQLLDFHRNLVEIDEVVKTGSSPASLSTHLDILCLSL